MSRCTIPACTREPSRFGSLCKYHVQKLSRHGSAWRPSIKAETLEPYRRAARRWIKHSRDGLWPPDGNHALRQAQRARIKHGLGCIHWEVARAGPYDRDPKWLPPKAKARNVLAALFDRWTPKDDPKDKTPRTKRRSHPSAPPSERILCAVLAVKLALRKTRWTPYGSDAEFGRVQIGKAILRLASGREACATNRNGVIVKRRVYQRSSGLILRHLGRIAEEMCDWITDTDLTAVLSLAHRSPSRHHHADGAHGTA